MSIQAEDLHTLYTYAQHYSRWALAVNIMESLHADKNGYYGNNGLGNTERVVIVSLKNPKWTYAVPINYQPSIRWTGQIMGTDNTIPACGQWGNLTSLTDYGWYYNDIVGQADWDESLNPTTQYNKNIVYSCSFYSSPKRGAYICSNGTRIQSEGDWRVSVYLLLVV